jgi:universal stress protein E
MIQSIVALIEPQTTEHSPTQPALRQALDLAKSLQAKLTVVLCCYELAAELDTLFLKDLVHNSRQPILRHQENWLKQLLLPYQQELAIEAEVLWHKHPHQALLELHKRAPFDLLVSQFHQHSVLNFHSLDWHLLHEVPVTTLMVHQAQSLSQMRVLIALDTQDAQHKTCNQAIMAHAKLLQENYQAQLTVCHAYPSLAGYTGLGMEPDPLLTQAAQTAIAEAHKENCLAFTQAYDIESVIVREGSAHYVVTELLANNDFDLLMVGGQQGKGLPGELFYHSYESLNDKRPVNLWVQKI